MVTITVTPAITLPNQLQLLETEVASHRFALFLLFHQWSLKVAINTYSMLLKAIYSKRNKTRFTIRNYNAE